MSELPAIRQLIPHDGPMVLLEELTSWSPGLATCTFRVRAGAPFVRAGRLPVVATIEHMAQAAAACMGYEALAAGGSVKPGMVIASRSVELEREELRVGDAVTVHVRCIRGNEQLSHFQVSLTHEGASVARCELTIYHGDIPEVSGAMTGGAE